MKKQRPTYLVDEIEVIKEGRNCYYIDKRTKSVKFDEMTVVKPIAWNSMYLWIVCPYCQKIHQYAILEARRKNNVVYGNCKGRFPLGIDNAPIKIDDSEMVFKK